MQPKYTNTFYYFKPSMVDDNSYSTFKTLAYASDILFLVSWIVASVNNNAATNVMDLEPDDNGEDGDHVHMKDDGKVNECDSTGDDDSLN